jgi:hypothetical protein
MALDLVDRFSTQLSSSCTAGDSTIVLSSVTSLLDSSGDPINGACDFYLMIKAEGSNTEEIVHVTNVNRGTKTLDITRAQAQTTASNHASNAVVKASIMTAQAFEQLKTDAGSAGSDFVRLSRQVLGSAAANITFSSIDQSYSHLKLIVNGRSANASTIDDMYCQVNGDTGSNYHRQYLLGTGSSTAAGKQAGVNNAVVGTLVGASGTANLPGSGVIYIPDYSQTSFYKTIISLGGMDDASNPYVVSVWWNWRSTAAITSIVLKMISGSNIDTNTTATLYGLK